MNRCAWAVPLLLCGLLLALSDTAAAAALSAVTLWLTRVLPALFPFYVATTLIISGGLYDAILYRIPQAALPACMLLGGIAGYPVGARLCALTARAEWSAYCNLCSPAFIIGVVSVNFLGEKGFAAPIMLAHYGASIIAALCASLLKPNPGARTHKQSAMPVPSLAEAISDGMHAMLKVGGCIVFFSVVAALLSAALHIEHSLLAAAMASLMEMTAGCRALSELFLPARLKCACMAAAISFGGLSVWMQAMSVCADIPIGKYLLSKGFQAAVAFLIAYALAPWLCPDACAVLSDTMETMIGNASSLTVLLLSASTGMVFAYLFALVMKKARSRKAASP